ncbi:hypothetical protein RHGRI_007188 [Rhododendron griersonianum]|uniref:RNase H type-1 domain-containing protein n=1 Tax=Rhododendron griersonianum TaxID=479676 RepID=A0AAV6KW34_9ERIC|nr:hypothetical protein RHGRI_007188 [Rhododendron griersonianum]
METDSLTAVRLLNGDIDIQHQHTALVEESKMLMSRTGTTITHVYRMANQSTDNLARLGADQQDEELVGQLVIKFTNRWGTVSRLCIKFEDLHVKLKDPPEDYTWIEADLPTEAEFSGAPVLSVNAKVIGMVMSALP